MFAYKQLELIKQKKPLSALTKAFVELWGFEPQTFALPARRSSQLSYSPVKKLKIKKYVLANTTGYIFFAQSSLLLPLKNLF